MVICPVLHTGLFTFGLRLRLHHTTRVGYAHYGSLPRLRCRTTFTRSSRTVHTHHAPDAVGLRTYVLCPACGYTFTFTAGSLRITGSRTPRLHVCGSLVGSRSVGYGYVLCGYTTFARLFTVTVYTVTVAGYRILPVVTTAVTRLHHALLPRCYTPRLHTLRFYVRSFTRFGSRLVIRLRLRAVLVGCRYRYRYGYGYRTAPLHACTHAFFAWFTVIWLHLFAVHGSLPAFRIRFCGSFAVGYHYTLRVTRGLHCGWFTRGCGCYGLLYHVWLRTWVLPGSVLRFTHGYYVTARSYSWVTVGYRAGYYVPTVYYRLRSTFTRSTVVTLPGCYLPLFPIHTFSWFGLVLRLRFLCGLPFVAVLRCTAVLRFTFFGCGLHLVYFARLFCYDLAVAAVLRFLFSYTGSAVLLGSAVYSFPYVYIHRLIYVRTPRRPLDCTTFPGLRVTVTVTLVGFFALYLTRFYTRLQHTFYGSVTRSLRYLHTFAVRVGSALHTRTHRFAVAHTAHFAAQFTTVACSGSVTHALYAFAYARFGCHKFVYHSGYHCLFIGSARLVVCVVTRLVRCARLDWLCCRTHTRSTRTRFTYTLPRLYTVHLDGCVTAFDLPRLPPHTFAVYTWLDCYIVPFAVTPCTYITVYARLRTRSHIHGLTRFTFWFTFCRFVLHGSTTRTRCATHRTRLPFAVVYTHAFTTLLVRLVTAVTHCGWFTHLPVVVGLPTTVVTVLVLDSRSVCSLLIRLLHTFTFAVRFCTVNVPVTYLTVYPFCGCDAFGLWPRRTVYATIAVVTHCRSRAGLRLLYTRSRFTRLTRTRCTYAHALPLLVLTPAVYPVYLCLRTHARLRLLHHAVAGCVRGLYGYTALRTRAVSPVTRYRLRFTTRHAAYAIPLVVTARGACHTFAFGCWFGYRITVGWVGSAGYAGYRFGWFTVFTTTLILHAGSPRTRSTRLRTARLRCLPHGCLVRLRLHTYARLRGCVTYVCATPCVYTAVTRYITGCYSWLVTFHTRSLHIHARCYCGYALRFPLPVCRYRTFTHVDSTFRSTRLLVHGWITTDYTWFLHFLPHAYCGLVCLPRLPQHVYLRRTTFTTPHGCRSPRGSVTHGCHGCTYTWLHYPSVLLYCQFAVMLRTVVRSATCIPLPCGCTGYCGLSCTDTDALVRFMRDAVAFNRGSVTLFSI